MLVFLGASLLATVFALGQRKSPSMTGFFWRAAESDSWRGQAAASQ
jgi:hypothetical protein